MKLLFLSDIHGSLFYTQRALAAYQAEGADYLVILGDELYHGPRNPLPTEYKPQEVANSLNKFADKIIAVRGNCDSEVDQMVLDFPMLAPYSTILYHGRRLFLTHGHIYSEEKLPQLSAGDLFIYGHTHLLRAEKAGDIFVINPGSVGLPKGDNPPTYGILVDNTFRIKNFNGQLVKELVLD